METRSVSPTVLQWNPSKTDNLELHILSGVSIIEGLYRCKLETIDTQKLVRHIEVSVIEGCPLSGVPLY